jgi:hypothetical protein
LSTWLHPQFVRLWVWEQSRLHVLEPTFFVNGAEGGEVRERALGPPTHPQAPRGAWRRGAGKGRATATATESTHRKHPPKAPTESTHQGIHQGRHPPRHPPKPPPTPRPTQAPTEGTPQPRHPPAKAPPKATTSRHPPRHLCISVYGALPELFVAAQAAVRVAPSA